MLKCTNDQKTRRLHLIIGYSIIDWSLRLGHWSLSPLQRDQILQSFAAANNLEAVAVDQHFRGARAVVVVAAHRKAVRAGREHRQQVAALGLGKGAVFREKVAAL